MSARNRDPGSPGCGPALASRPSNRWRSRAMPTIAIIGSTGRNAVAWTEAFLAAGFGIRSLARIPEALPRRPGVTPVGFDLDDPATHAPALAATDVLALVTPADPRQTGRELALIEAAR